MANREANRVCDAGNFDLKSAIRQFESLYIEHERIRKVLQEIKEVVAIGNVMTEAPCIQVGGPPGAGKTTIRAKLAQEYVTIKDGRQSEIDGYVVTADYIPILQIEMPPYPSIKSVCYTILAAFGEKQIRQAPETVLSMRVLRYLKACGTSALLVDEAQRAVDRRGVVAAETLADWFKWIHGVAGISLVFFGLGRLRYLFDQDSQLSRRWNSELRLDEYWWLTESGAPNFADQEMFVAILAAYKESLPIPMSLNIEDERTAFRFFYATQGIFGPLKKLLREAIRVASISASPRIDITVMELAFDRGIRSSGLGLENPFRRGFSMAMPPRPLDDGLLLAPTEVRRRAKSKKMLRAEIQMKLTK